MLTLKKNNLKFALIGLTIILTTACTKGTSNANTEQLILPTIVQYSKSTQKQLAGELESGSCPISKEFITDYGIMRDEVRAATN